MPANKKTVIVKLEIHPNVAAWLEDMRAIGVWGNDVPAVAETLICRGVREQLTSGLLRYPPPMPRG